jgi:D-alanyl-D-alanine carboxypeptidase/D-alanyl-D-alanine-endopeptidase (penicillin-binding protein 4)
LSQPHEFSGAHVGFALGDATSGRVLYSFQGHKGFIPASTTKLLTLYLSLKMLPAVLTRGFLRDSAGVTFRIPSGDPTFLHPDFEHWTGQIAEKPVRVLMPTERAGPESWGKGWAWDDALESYSPEISPLPLYGNVFRWIIDSLGKPVPSQHWVPKVFIEDRGVAVGGFAPGPGFQVRYHPGAPLTDGQGEMPIRSFRAALSGLLATSPAGSWQLVDCDTFPDFRRLWTREAGAPRDTVLRYMMHRSDNFLAEQLLLQCAVEETGGFHIEPLLERGRDSLLKSLPNPLRWVDGSGLSRYNLNTPLNNIWLLSRMWQEYPREYLLRFLCTPTEGTLRSWEGLPAGTVWAKTGSMRGVQCISGYLRTRKGNWVTFSFMVNHFIGGGKGTRQRIAQVLKRIAES